MSEQLEFDRIGSLTLILGGVRSGKSQFGNSLAQSLGGDDVLFVATAEPRDGEMSRRIELHRKSRCTAWRTFEKTIGVGSAMAEMPELPAVVLVDCLTLLVSNRLLANCDEHTDPISDETFAAEHLEELVRREIDSLCQLVRSRNVHLIIVSGEVGMGVVPESRLGRMFRDLLGWSNQSIASQADATYLMVAGLAVNVAAIATDVQNATRQIRHRDIDNEAMPCSRS